MYLSKRVCFANAEISPEPRTSRHAGVTTDRDSGAPTGYRARGAPVWDNREDGLGTACAESARRGTQRNVMGDGRNRMRDEKRDWVGTVDSLRTSDPEMTKPEMVRWKRTLFYFTHWIVMVPHHPHDPRLWDLILNLQI